MTNSHFKRHLIHLCDIRRNSTEPPPQSSSGEPIPDYESESDAYTDQRCRYVQKRELIADASQGFPVSHEHILILPEDVSVRLTDIVDNIRLYSDSSVVDAGPFTIEQVLNRNRRSEHHVTCYLERVSQG